jgi:hypothetical protein
MQLLLMANQWEVYNVRGEFAKGTHYRLISSFYVYRHLASLSIDAESGGTIIGVPTSKRGPRLTHLFFTDNNLIFCKANSVEWRRMLKILEKYDLAWGKSST